MTSTSKFYPYVPIFLTLFNRADPVLSKLLDRKNLKDDLSESDEKQLKDLIHKKRMNLDILKWLKDSLIQDYEGEKRRVEDMEDRYAKGKIEIKILTREEKNMAEFDQQIEREIKTEKNKDKEFDKDLEELGFEDL